MAAGCIEQHAACSSLLPEKCATTWLSYGRWSVFLWQGPPLPLPGKAGILGATTNVSSSKGAGAIQARPAWGLQGSRGLASQQYVGLEGTSASATTQKNTGTLLSQALGLASRRVVTCGVTIMSGGNT